MSLVKIIDGVPTYSTIQEALDYGATYNISGYHVHIVNGQTTYMAGTSHDEITSLFRLSTEAVQIPDLQTGTVSARSSGSRGSSGSSGGGGY
tara:strand:+ start:81 stop:356 length:276 start_codon:yes stop_codon:yes gene_type:complete